MASGKLSPRQRMINLMYLVFIAMIAMQMSKEVLSAFGYMNEKLTDNNTLFEDKNLKTYENLKGKASEQPEKYGDIFKRTEQIKDLTVNFNGYLEGLKTIFLKDVEDPKDYESMDKTGTVDEYLFLGDKYTKEGQEFLDHVNGYRDGVIKILGENNPLTPIIKKRFDTSDQQTKDGKQAWLKNRYEGFPLISTITNLTSMQNDVKMTSYEILNFMLGGQLESDVSMSNYKTILIVCFFVHSLKVYENL